MPILWVDTNKGDDENPEYRSRIAAKDLKTKRDPNMPAIDSFAPMPALEMMKLLLSLASMWRKTSRGHTLCIMVVDVRKAHWNAAARRTIYIRLPEEDAEEGMCGLCLKSLYGFLDAASCWHDEVSNMLTENGFHVGKACPALFRHEKEEVIGLVHGDDFDTLSDDRGQDFFEACLTKRYQYSKKGRLGPRSSDSREIKVLNRYVRWPEGGNPEYEADPRHAQILARELNLEGGKSVTTPIVKYDVHNDGELKGADVKKFRSLTMRGAYLVQDRYDIQHATKSFATEMKTPTNEGMVSLKRLGRYLKGKPRVVQEFKSQKTGYSKPAVVEHR